MKTKNRSSITKGKKPKPKPRYKPNRKKGGSGQRLSVVDTGRFALAKRTTEPERKVSATLEAISAGIYTGNKPEKAIEEFMRAYGAFTWVYASIYAIASSAAGVPFLLFKEWPNGETEEVLQHPILDLLNRPNPVMSGHDLIELTYTQMEATGNTFWELVTDSYGVIKEVYPLNPKRMNIEVDPKKYVGKYVFEVNGKDVYFTPDQIEHFKYPNPDNDFWGMSPMTAVRLNALPMETSAMEWNKKFFQNSARPDLMFTVEEAMGERAFRRFVSRLKQMFRGTAKAHSALIGEGGVKVEKIGFPPKDLEFINMRKFNREEILACYGVPPVMVGVFDSAIRANAAVQRRIFWESTMVPKLKKIEEQLNMSFVSRFDRFVDGDAKLALRFNLSSVDALRDVASDMTDRVTKQVDSRIITRNEARLELGYETMGPEMDVIAGQGSGSPASPGVGDGGAEENVEMIQSPGMEKFKDPKYREMLRKQADDRKRPFEEKMAEDWGKLFASIAKDVNERLDILLKGRRRKLYANIVSVDSVFPAEAAGKAAKDVLEEELKIVMRAGGGFATLELSIDLAVNAEGFNDVAPNVVEFVRNEAFEKSNLITVTTKKRLRKILDDAFAREATLNQIKGLVTDELTGTAAEARIATIVRTEVGTAYSKSNRFAAEQVLSKNPGVNLYKVWISVRDDKVRDSHRQNDSLTQKTPVPFDFVYPNGMLHPHGPAGGPEEVINCRCAERYVSGTLVDAGFKRYRRVRTTDGVRRVMRRIEGPFSKPKDGNIVIARRVGDLVMKMMKEDKSGQHNGITADSGNENGNGNGNGNGRSRTKR